MGILGGQDLLLLILLGILLFGRKLPETARALGKTATEFRKGLRGLDDEVREPVSQRAAIDPEPVRAPQRVVPTAAQKPAFDDAPAQPTLPPRV